MSAALQVPPACPALLDLAAAPPLFERRMVVRRPVLVAVPVALRPARLTVGDDEVREVPGDDASGVTGDVCRRAAESPASTADPPMGRSLGATARRVTGAKAAPGLGRAAEYDEVRPPIDVVGLDGVDDATERRNAVDAATPAAALPAPMGAAAIADRVRRAMASAALADLVAVAAGADRGSGALGSRRIEAVAR